MAELPDIWGVAETEGERATDIALEVLGDAREIADAVRGRVTCVVLGSAGEGVIDELGRRGADRILMAPGGGAQARSAERCAGALAAALDRETPRLVLLGATPLGRDVAARLAAARRLALASGCNWVKITPAGAVEAARVVYGGKLYARVRLRTTPAIATLRPGAGGPGKEAPRRPEVEALPALEGVATRVEHVAFVHADPRTVDIAEAERIVAVGRGIGSRERLELYERLAERLGAALAASRPVVDKAWLPFERQVGQTGRVVAPRLYVAAGISGASQHTLGMKGSECVVAINRDRSAEIFKLADLKVVADLETLVPALLEKLGERGAA